MTADVNYRALFEQAAENWLLLAPDPPRFTIVAASEAYLSATRTRREEIIGRPLFEVFPDNPAIPGAMGADNLTASLHKVIQSRKADQIPTQQYDIRTPEGEFEERYWELLSVPVFDDRGDLSYILHRAADMTEWKVREDEQRFLS